MVDKAEDALLEWPEAEIFQRGGQLVCVVETLMKEAVDGVTRDIGALAIQLVSVPQLVEIFTTCAEWQKYDGRSEGWRAVDCPSKMAATYLSRAGRWQLPVLAGIIEAPTLRPDGSILEKPGYDTDTFRWQNNSM